MSDPQGLAFDSAAEEYERGRSGWPPEELPLGDAAADAAFVAEAFHWDAPYDPPLPDEAHAAIEEVAARTGPAGRPKVEAGAWREGLADAPFTPLAYRETPHVDVTDRDGVIAYYLSVSSIADRPQEERDALRAKLERLVPEAEYTLRLRAEVWTARRR